MAAYWESDGVDDMVVVQGSYAGTPGNFTAFELDIMVLAREDWHQIINFGGYIVNFQSNTLNITANSNLESMWINGEPVVSGTPFLPIGERVLFRGQTKAGVSTGPTGSSILSNSVSQFLQGRIYGVKMYQGATLGLHYDPSTGTMLDQSGNGRHATVTGGTYGNDEVAEPDIIDGAGSLSATVSLSAAGSLRKRGSTNTTLHTSFITSGRLRKRGGAELTASVVLVAMGEDSNLTGAALLQSSVGITASGRLRKRGGMTESFVGMMAAQPGRMRHQGSVGLQASGALALGIGLTRVRGAALLSLTSNLAGTLWLSGLVTPANRTTVNASPVVRHEVSVSVDQRVTVGGGY